MPSPARDDPTARSLSGAEWAFVRAWAEGLDVALAWARYHPAGPGGDARRARADLQVLLERLATLARRNGRMEVAALLRRDPSAMVQGPDEVPTLDAFREQHPPDFYSEAELVDLHRETYGRASASSSRRRRERLRSRLLDALRWLAEQPVRLPTRQDTLRQWLDDRLCDRLAQAGLLLFEDLLARIEAKGTRWTAGIPRVGPESAERLHRWLREHAQSLGPLPLAVLGEPPTRVQLQAPAAQTAVVPLERFVLPAHLSGVDGRNRAPADRCKLAARNDLEALHAWLRLRTPASHTWRAYRKEAERFLLWAVMHRGRALSSLDGDDCVAFRDFLAAPPADWCSPRHVPRWSPDWRPFEGALSSRSADTAITIVRALCEWLVRRHYLDSNPWDDVPARTDAPAMPQLRALSERQWQWVQDWLQDPVENPPGQSPTIRLRFAIRLAYSTGLRLSELAAARVEALREEALDNGELVWSLQVLGKRRRWREVPLPHSTVESLGNYLEARGYRPQALDNPPATPLLACLNSTRPLSAARVYELFAEAFRRCATWVEPQDPRSAQRIRRATTHWLRHTYGSHGAARGVPQDVLQANLGHASLATTSIYITAEKTRRHAAIRGAFDTSARPRTEPIVG